MKIQTLHSILSVKFGLNREGKCCYTYDLPKEEVLKIGTLESYNHPGLAPSISETW